MTGRSHRALVTDGSLGVALARLGVAPAGAAFVAGSGYDLFGTAAVGLRTYWHNRAGLARPEGAPPADVESKTLDGLPDWLATFSDGASSAT